MGGTQLIKHDFSVIVKLIPKNIIILFNSGVHFFDLFIVFTCFFNRTSAFLNCVSLRKVTLDGVKYIGDNAFSHCSRLTEVVLPDSLTVIGRSAFSYSGITEITLPRNLLCIGNGAFSNCSKLTNVCVLRVVYIGDYVFASAPDSSYTLPSSLKYIGADAFMRRSGVEYTVDFAGTKAEWESIEKHKNWIAPTVVRCTDGDIVEQQDEE